MSKLFAFFLFFLGFYQFTEFMLCQTGQAEIWAKLGFVAYTFLPALGLHAPLMFFNLRTNYFYIYIIPGIYSVAALLNQNFITDSMCATLFVRAGNALFQTGTLSQTVIFYLYCAYYFGFIIASCAISLYFYYKTKDSYKRKIYLMFPLGVMLMSLPTFILIIIFPTFHIAFPSILCHFALLLALLTFVSVRLEEQYLSEFSSNTNGSNVANLKA